MAQGGVQTMKSANLLRVDTGKAFHLYAARQMLGESATCPASAQLIQNDVYGRPATQNTIGLGQGGTERLEASCGQGSQFPSYRHIQRENMERPYIPTCTAGLRGHADFMGRGRDLHPQNLYGGGKRGNFVKHYDTRNNAPWDEPDSKELQRGNFHFRVEQPWSFDKSHDASQSAIPK